MFDFGEAADFAGRVEELARSIEYLQIVAAQAVERTREEAKHARAVPAVGGTSGWLTGWTGNDTPADHGRQTAGSTAQGSVLDDGYRNAAEFLRARLRIEIREARRRLSQAATLLPTTTLTGEPLPPRHPELAQALTTTLIPSRAATIITGALDQVALIAHPDTLTAMEHALTRTGIETDPDFVSKTARRWINRIDQDGPEPSEEELRTLQGAFIRKPRRGLHHIEIFATAEQYETLATIMNTATNPRLTPNTTDQRAQTTTPQEATATTLGTTTTANLTDQAGQTEPVGQTGEAGQAGQVVELDRRSRAQKLLDGLVGGCALALKTGRLPANGGLKPQLTTYIHAHELLPHLQTNPTTPPHNHRQADNTGSGAGSGADATSSTGGRLSSASATFAGPIHPSTLRKIACDADILPVLLGSDGQILDIGRTTRIFPPNIRKALNARDQGCAFPDCTMPAPWCEAHHITYWSHGGPTSIDNGVLLCSHHHHLIHKEQWKITTNNGIPWFTPPPHIDPTQTPRRNHHHRPMRR